MQRFIGLLLLMAYMGPASAQLMNLHAAATAGDSQRVKQIITSGEKIDMADTSGRTPLLRATAAGHTEVARLLIEAGADVNAKDQIQDSPYLLAGAQGRLEILQMTLAHGADLKSTNRYGGTALIPAAERGYVETVRTLIAAGVEVDHINNLGWTALLEAVILGNGGAEHLAIVDLLLKAGADVNLADRDGVTALQHAQQRGYSAIAKRLQENGVAGY